MTAQYEQLQAFSKVTEDETVIVTNPTFLTKFSQLIKDTPKRVQVKLQQHGQHFCLDPDGLETVKIALIFSNVLLSISFTGKLFPLENCDGHDTICK